MTLKYIVFDFDGTLADSREIFISIYNEIAHKYGYKALLLSDIEQLRALSILERARLLQVPIYHFPFLVMEFTKKYRKMIPDLSFFEGIPALLGQLKNSGYKLAIVSSNSEKNIKEFLEKQQCTDIDEVLSSGNVFGKHKTLQKFLTKHRLQASEILYVGDEYRDIEACRTCGIKVVWVSWGYDVKETLKEMPDYMAHSREELLQVVGKAMVSC